MGCKRRASPSHGSVRKPANEFEKGFLKSVRFPEIDPIADSKLAWQVYILDQNRKNATLSSGRVGPYRDWSAPSSAIQPRASPCSRLVRRMAIVDVFVDFSDDVLTLMKSHLSKNPRCRSDRERSQSFGEVFDPWFIYTRVAEEDVTSAQNAAEMSLARLP